MTDTALAPDTTNPSSNQTPADASVILNLETLIKSHTTGIEKRKEEAKKYKEMIDDVLMNDETYKLHAEKAKEATRLKTNTKQQIFRTPQVADMANKLKTLKEEAKEMEASLSDYLREYQRMSGVNEIETDDGQVREIVYIAKLVKRGKRVK